MSRPDRFPRNPPVLAAGAQAGENGYMTPTNARYLS
jgi:hypothetical protein